MPLGLRHRIAAAWQAFKHAEVYPHYAVVYDRPQLDIDGEPTGDVFEEYYEAFNTPEEANELFRTAFPKDADRETESARLVMILGDIDRYREQPR